MTKQLAHFCVLMMMTTMTMMLHTTAQAFVLPRSSSTTTAAFIQRRVSSSSTRDSLPLRTKSPFISSSSSSYASSSSSWRGDGRGATSGNNGGTGGGGGGGGSGTALHAIRRRTAFDRLKRAVLTGIGVSTATKFERLQEAGASDPDGITATDARSGKIVTMEVDNVGGEPGNTGTIKIQLQPSWAPRGVERFEQLTSIGFWDGCRIFRVIPGFIAQFGINGDPTLQGKWRGQILKDDPVRVTNARGTVVFATAGPNSRTTQVFINTRDGGNGFLDNQGFSPIGKVIEGMDVVDRLYAGYGEGPPAGKGPNQAKIQLQGNSYLTENYPKLSYFRGATISDP